MPQIPTARSPETLILRFHLVSRTLGVHVLLMGSQVLRHRLARAGRRLGVSDMLVYKGSIRCIR